MAEIAYCIFETAIGACGIAWREPEDGGDSSAVVVTGFQLPEATRQKTEVRMARQAGAEAARVPPAAIANLIERVQRHLGGELTDFADVPVDMGGCEPFSLAVYAAARHIPTGQSRTYGALARILGQPGAAQAVGQALGNNPIPLIVPCHRIVAADGKGGGFSAHGGLKAKERLLVIEGAMTGELGF